MAKKRSETAAFQGERGAFSQQAVVRLLGESAEVLPCQRFEEVFQNLQKKRVTAAVIPIENTLAGSVHENYDHLLNYDFQIVGETSVRIVHNLIVPPGVAFRQVRRVFSHPVALNQCLQFFVAKPASRKGSLLRHGRQREDDHGRGTERRRGRLRRRSPRRSTAARS